MDLALFLLKKIIFHQPIVDCLIQGAGNDWKDLPKSKSLFYARPGCGLPIGNLTSQLFGNVYLSDFDHFVKGTLKIRYYGRYVDDMIFVHQDKEILKTVILEIKKYLRQKLKLELHPNKIYLQHFSRGVKFLGVIIKPYRLYISNRIKGNFYWKIKKFDDKRQRNNLSQAEVEKFIAVVNSYFGLFGHYKTKKLCCRANSRLPKAASLPKARGFSPPSEGSLAFGRFQIWCLEQSLPKAASLLKAGNFPWLAEGFVFSTQNKSLPKAKGPFEGREFPLARRRWGKL